MKFKTHSKLMSHLLLAEKHQQILLKNAEARPAREIHATISTGAPAVHLSEAPKRSPRGFQRRSNTRQFKPKHRDKKLRYDKSKHKNSKHSTSTCHKCGRQGHFAQDCRASAYIVEMYRELQKLRNQHRESHAVSIPESPPYHDDVENFMVLRDQTLGGCTFH